MLRVGKILKSSASAKIGFVIAIIALLSAFNIWPYAFPLSSSAFWSGEVQRRGWRVLHSTNSGNRYLAICNAGPNQLAIVDSDSTSHQSTQLEMMNSDGGEILTKSKNKWTPITCVRWGVYSDLGGWIYTIDVPGDKRIKIVKWANRVEDNNVYAGEGETLVDVEVIWID